MSDSLFDVHGARKCVVPQERISFVKAAMATDPEFASFCLTLVITGARISEVLTLNRTGVDVADGGIIFRTLKQRGKKKFRLVPASAFLLNRLIAHERSNSSNRIWAFRRTYAWNRVKAIMRSAGIGDKQCLPKALRHGFAVNAVLNGVPLNIVQRWMGHARLETAAIYASVLGDEERCLARRAWSDLECMLREDHQNYAQSR